jgi:F-type H+-transporting ATPase subunit epsilon
MGTEFKLIIFSPVKKLLETSVTEVILPGFDGEIGILSGHKDFVGLLGTGALKLVHGGNDFWFMVSSGVFEVRKGELRVITELGEAADEIDSKLAKIRIDEIEPQLTKFGAHTEEYKSIYSDYLKQMARLEVYRRTSLLN